jgi:hypothetical protein
MEWNDGGVAIWGLFMSGEMSVKSEGSITNILTRT